MMNLTEPSLKQALTPPEWLLVAVIATAVALATVPSLLSIVFIAAGIWLKARIEENWLCAELGEGEYDAYRKRVPMLVPFMRP